VQQKRYRYTNKERDDSSGLCYYGARYLAPWLARWISPDSTGVDEVAIELVVGLSVVFATFAENVGANVQGGALLF
jgi:Kef-type K+ transport system membrane component KefB